MPGVTVLLSFDFLVYDALEFGLECFGHWGVTDSTVTYGSFQQLPVLG